MPLEENCYCKKGVNFAGKYKGTQNVTISNDGVNLINVIETVVITITKVNDGIDAYTLNYKFSDRPDINGLGNVIDNKLIHIAPSSTYNYFEKKNNNKLLHKFVGLNEVGISLSGTGALYKQKI